MKTSLWFGFFVAALTQYAHACEQSVADGLASGNVVIAAQTMSAADRPTYIRQLTGIRDGLGLSDPAEPLEPIQSGVFYRISVGEPINNLPFRQHRYEMRSSVLDEVSITLSSVQIEGECRVFQVHFDSPDNAAGDVFESLFESLELELL